MRSRWTRFLPGFPAVLLMPAFLALWAVLCFVPKEGWTRGGLLFEATLGFPFDLKSFVQAILKLSQDHPACCATHVNATCATARENACCCDARHHTGTHA